MWYPGNKLQYRIALFLGMAVVAGTCRVIYFDLCSPSCSGAFSGLVAYGISFMNNTGGLRGWSWIFVRPVLFVCKCCINLVVEIIEGLMTIVISGIAAIGRVLHSKSNTALTPL